MITNITLENFKCFRHVSINPKLLTVLIGPNGTGKSSILQALLLLKQSVGEERLKFQGKFVNFSDSLAVAPMIPSVSTNTLIGIAGTSKAPELGLGGGADTQVGFYLQTTFHPDEHGVYKCTGTVEAMVDGRLTEFVIPSQENRWRATINNWYAEFDRSDKFGEFGRVRAYNGGDTFAKDISAAVQTPNWQLGRIRFVQSARGFVRPNYPLGEEPSEETSLDEGLSELEEQLATNLVYITPTERLSGLLKQVTNSGLGTKMIPGRRVEVKSIVRSGEVNIVGEGFGTNALVQLLMELVGTQERGTVLVEEPEIHLHPSAQADLAQVMAKEAKDFSKQIIMTTHSEYVAGRLLTLVAEGKLTTDDLAIYSFQKDEKGECTATEIEVTERGQTKGGLSSFDEATRDEMRRYADGLRKNA